MRKNANKSYYTEETMNLLHTAYMEAYEEFKAGKLKHVKISNGNSKMGKIPSVSLLPYLTCPGNCKGTCGDKCYAAKLSALRPSVRKSYARNTILAIFAPETYWADVERAIKLTRFFRFHVSGDILSPAYFEHMVQIAKRNPGTQILAFTKRFEWVNAFKLLPDEWNMPSNLHILFSGWTNLKPDNPFSFPETIVYDKKATPNPEWLLCGGNCETCACRGVGCWQAKQGDTIAFKIH